MYGVLKIAYKLLVNDRAKFAALLATVINIGAKIRVMDPAVQTVANAIPMPDFVLGEVRSIPNIIRR
jgi:putative ABC transport system permease protein